MNKNSSLLLLSILSLLILIFVRCGPAPTPAPEEFPDPQPFEAPTLPSGSELPEVSLRPGQAVVSDQIIVTGPGQDIDRVIGDLPELGLERLTSTSLRYLQQYETPDLQEGDSAQQSRGKQRAGGLASMGRQQVAALRIDLYAFSASTPPLGETLQQIADKVEALQNELQVGVVAEPNYVMGFEITGDPWAVEGSPWAVEGSPWAVEGSASATGPHASDTFWQQWALQEHPGVNLFSRGTAPAERAVQSSGEGTRVLIFDTSPFPGSGGYRFERWGPADFPSLALTVSQPVMVPASQAEEGVAPISDHGLFVAGLVYAVAPQSDIHLIRVLNDYGQGTLQAFIEALNLSMQQTLADQGTLQNSVINLSLGTSEPDDEELPPEARRAIRRMMELWGYQPISQDGTPIFSLELPMVIANQLGAVVVAASGNDSAEQPETDPLPPQIPAAYPQVIGVEASNQNATRSCFANVGDLAAPGGEGGQLPEACQPVLDTCPVDDGSCGAGVISYVLAAHKGYAYWVGTSFATPLVSGLSALVQESQAGADPALVQSSVGCAAQATGVVDVVAALGSCP